MGKKNANKKNQSQPAAPAQSQEPEMEQVDDQGRVLTPLEKATQYKEMQHSVFANFIKDFEAEEQSILGALESATQLEKQRDIEKREREEVKRLEKTVFKKEMQEVEELYANANVKGLRDRIAKTINEGIIKQQKVLQRAVQLQGETENAINKAKQEMNAALQKKNMLHSLCKGLLEKNYELYLKHETMLEDERGARQGLASTFGDKMKEVQSELDEQKSKRAAEIEENQRLRSLIQKAIDEYRVKEEAYRAKMDLHGRSIQEIEKKLKSTIDGTVTKTLKEAESEKLRFTRVADRVKELSTQINSYMGKFDEIKEEMSDNSRKFEAYQQQVETKKVEIRSLEVEIENIQMVEKRQGKVAQEIAEEKGRMVNQVETLRKLANALKMQYENTIKQ